MRCALLVWLGLVTAAAAQTGDDPLGARLQQLEAETRALRQEVETLRAQPGPVALAPAAPATAPQAAPGVAPLPAVADPPPKPADEGYYTMDEIKTEMKKLVWTKGDFKIVPYGILWGSSVYETGRSNPGDYTLYVLPRRVDDNQEFHVDGRSTRLGVDISGPPVPFFNCAAAGGKVEVDFQRNIDTENRSGVLLRHAYVEVKDDDSRLLLGQTWDVISPLYPGMLMYSIGWGGGNIGYRRAQLRGERYYNFSDTFRMTIQGSANADIITDTGTNLTTEQAGWPVLMGRIGTTIGPRGQGCKPIEIGVSSHIGETIYDIRPPFLTPVTGLNRRTWSINADVRVPIGERFGVQGEAFTGENLGSYFGGVLQGIDLGSPANPVLGVVGVPGSLEPIGSSGGWVDIWYDWTCRLHSHFGYGIDDPFDQDITVGRTQNSFFFTNISFDLTEKFLIGFEYSQWRTLWKGSNDGDSSHFDLVAKYFF